MMKTKLNKNSVISIILIILMIMPNEANVAEAAKVKSIKTNKQLTLTEGQQSQLKATVKPKSQAKKVKWKTSNKKVATVTKTGLVKAKKKGTATITAYIGKKKSTCKVRVQAKQTVKPSPTPKPTTTPKPEEKVDKYNQWNSTFVDGIEFKWKSTYLDGMPNNGSFGDIRFESVEISYKEPHIQQPATVFSGVKAFDEGASTYNLRVIGESDSKGFMYYETHQYDKDGNIITYRGGFSLNATTWKIDSLGSTITVAKDAKVVEFHYSDRAAYSYRP